MAKLNHPRYLGLDVGIETYRRGRFGRAWA